MKDLQSKRRVSKQKGIAAAISRVICGIMVIVFLLLIVSVSITAGKGLMEETTNSLQSIAKSNGVQIQEYMNICETTAKGLVEEIQKTALEKNKLKSENEELEASNISDVYSELSLNSLEKQLEGFLISTAKSAVANNDAVIGIGIMFEPYQYTDKRESYALYFTEENGEVGVSDVGAYEEFSANDYYQIAVGKDDIVFTAPYTYRDMWMITGAMPMLVDGNMIGVINIDVSMSVFDQLDLRNANYPSMEASVISKDGTIDFDSGNADNISKNVTEAVFSKKADADKVLAAMQSGQSFSHYYNSLDFGKNVYSFYYPLQAGNEVWATVTTVEAKDVKKETFITIVLLIILSIIFLALISYVISRTLRIKLAPIQDVVNAAKRISAGHLDIELESKSDDEIGVLADTFKDTSIFLKAMIDDISKVLEKIAKNDFTAGTSIEYEGDFVKIRESFEDIINNLNTTLQEVKSSSKQVAIGADQMADTAQTLADDAQEQALSTEKLKNSVKEVTCTVELNAEHAVEASTRVERIGNEVEHSNKKMEELVAAISKITETSKHIEMIIQNIESIASQTNLLSLNAAIEAARAGEAGKGFAVVAEEIRELANQSAQAAQSTRQLIGESISAVGNGTTIAGETEKAMLSLVEQTKGIVSTIEKIAKASNEQKYAIEEIENSVGVILELVQNNSGASEEASATSEELKAQADMLMGRISEFVLKD